MHLALHEGVSICHKNGIKWVILEGDCLILVKSLKKENNRYWDFMFTWKKLFNFLKAFDTWKISFCRKLHNKVADHLSKLNRPTFTSFLPSATNERYIKEKRSVAFRSIELEENKEVNSSDFNICHHEANFQFHQLM